MDGGGPAGIGSSSGPALKIVYWGPGRSGKTTNLLGLHARVRPELRRRLVTLATPGERTLFFDCLPLDLDVGRGRSILLKLYTVPGQARFERTRQLLLQGVDGLVFVWDSQRPRRAENLASLDELRRSLSEEERVLGRVPVVVQCNKRDLPDPESEEDVTRLLASRGLPVPRVPAVAARGQGVLETLAWAARLSIRRLGPT